MSHGEVITIDDPSGLDRYGFTRQRFLDPSLLANVSGKVAASEELLFLANDIAESPKKREYKLIIHGILPCGSKTTVTVDGIYPYVDVRVDALVNNQSVNNQSGNNRSEDDESTLLRRLVQRVKRMFTKISDEVVSDPRVEIVRGKDFMYFDHEEHEYARIFFRDLQTRSDFLALCKSEKIKTFSNDARSYYRAVSRNFELNLAGWNILRHYKIDYETDSKSRYAFRVDIANIKSIVNDNDLEQHAQQQGLDPSVLKYENLIVSSFDIEMIPHVTGQFPDAGKNPKDSIFMICMTYHFAKRSASVLSVCLTLKETDPLNDILVVHCSSEWCLLLAFSKFMGMMQPDFITEFNGGGFDWRNIIVKTCHFNVHSAFLSNMSLVTLANWEKTVRMMDRFHREVLIKISGASAPCISKGFKMQGFVGFDTLIVFKQLEPNADSHKLNECLRRCNLGSKDEMDVTEMFRIYREGSREEMKLVAHYCYIDTLKLQQLLLKKNVIQDRREVANLSYTSLYDNFQFAGGSRMRNLLMNRGANLGYLFDTQYQPTIPDPDAKFPGAYVVPPVKGIVKPTLRLDEYLVKMNLPTDQLQEGCSFIKEHFEILYHHYDQESQERMQEVAKMAPAFMKSYVEYVFATTTQYPVSGLDYASLYPSIMMTYNISPEKLIIDPVYAAQLQKMGYDLQHVSFPFCGVTMDAWFVRHRNVEADYSVCGKLLIELFDRRAQLKDGLKVLTKSIYEMEQEMKPYMERDALSEYPRLGEYNNVKFDQVGCDSKQKAVKIFMNTLYGEMGNFVSCICAVQVSGGVTTMGRYNLRLAKTFVEAVLKMQVYYGDTDSLYVSCNPRYFVDIDREFFTGQIDKLLYGTRLVEKTFEQIEIAKHRVNEYLQQDNGSSFLKMAYEEVLFPAAFLSKKKYFGVAHEEFVDFYPQKLFLRGLEIVKRGCSKVLKDVVDAVIREVMDIVNTRDIIDVVKQAIVRVFKTKWPIEAFAKTKVYRPDKKNPSVLAMVARYQRMNHPMTPKPNVRFKVVVCKYYPWGYDLRGKQEFKLSIGDRMELVERAIEENLPIDLEYYFDNELTSQLARLITFCKEVSADVPPTDILAIGDLPTEAQQKEIYDQSDSALFKAAKQYIGWLAKVYSNAYVNRGNLHKSTWREVCNSVGSHGPVALSVVAALVLDIFAPQNNSGASALVPLSRRLLDWATIHVKKQYSTSITDDQYDSLRQEFENVIEYITESDLEPVLMDYMTVWKCNIIRYIRKEYNYGYICESNLTATSIWDVMNREELTSITRDPNLCPSFTSDQAMKIVEMISSVFGRVLTSEQLTARQEEP